MARAGAYGCPKRPAGQDADNGRRHHRRSTRRTHVRGERPVSMRLDRQLTLRVRRSDEADGGVE